MFWGVTIIVLAAIAASAYVRLAPDDPAQWHVDPLTVEKPSYPGHYLMRPVGGDTTGPVFETTPEKLLAAFNDIVVSTPRVTTLAGSPDEGLVTYVARSGIWGFPDYISVKAVPNIDGARLAIFSRLRYGTSDLGANRARIEDWINVLRDRLS